jgi:hypothetical protein
VTKPAPKAPTIADTLTERLKQKKRTTKELAEAAEVPEEYIDQLISGKRRAPLPSRTDIYEKMTRFLEFGRNDLAALASAERASTASLDTRAPASGSWEMLLELCDPETARELERRSRGGDTELAGLIERVLGVAQGSVRRTLDDQIGLRIAAAQRGSTYEVLRLRVLEFLDATPGTLSAEDVTNFIKPRISKWDVDLASGVLKVILRAHETPEPDRRRPSMRSSGGSANNMG